jgi:hypothetical protein
VFLCSLFCDLCCFLPSTFWCTSRGTGCFCQQVRAIAAGSTKPSQPSPLARAAKIGGDGPFSFEGSGMAMVTGLWCVPFRRVGFVGARIVRCSPVFCLLMGTHDCACVWLLVTASAATPAATAAAAPAPGGAAAGGGAASAAASPAAKASSDASSTSSPGTGAFYEALCRWVHG